MSLLKSKKGYCFKIDMEVRDYELDCEQIVNNANYLHYMEHTRHKFCIHAGMPFIEMHQKGIDAVVRKIEIEYMASLRSGESFVSCLAMERKGPRFIFYQDIMRPDGEMCASAIVSIVVLNNGKLTRGDELIPVFGKYLK